MSVVELGLRSRTTFTSTIPQMQLEPATHYEASWHFLQSELDLKSARLRLLLDFTNGLVAHVELNHLLTAVTTGTRQLMQSEFAILGLLDLETGRLWLDAVEFADDRLLETETVNSLGETLAAHISSTGKPWTGISTDLAV